MLPLEDLPDTLRVIFRHGPNDRSFVADDYQNELHRALDQLRAFGFDVEAQTYDAGVPRSAGRLTGVFIFPFKTFPPEVGRVMADWLDRRPERRVCVVLGDFITNAFTPADALKIASRRTLGGLMRFELVAPIR